MPQIGAGNVLSCSYYMEVKTFDAVGWAAGRAFALYKTEWWDAGVVICHSGVRCSFAYGLANATATH